MTKNLINSLFYYFNSPMIYSAENTEASASVIIVILPAYEYRRLTVLFILGKSLLAYLFFCTYFVPIILDKPLQQPACTSVVLVTGITCRVRVLRY